MPSSPLSVLLASIYNALSSVCLIALFYLWGLPAEHLAVSIAVWSFFASLACASAMLMLTFVVGYHVRRQRAKLGPAVN